MNLEALHKISYGTYVVTAKKGDKLNGQIANSVFQVTAEPPQIAVSINLDNFTHSCIEESQSFGISVLSQDTPLRFIGDFGFKCGEDYDKLESVDYKKGKTGVPIILDHSVAYIEADVVEKKELGTHTLFIGEVIDADIIKNDKVMTYEYYHDVKRGTLSQKASHYVKKEEE
ncbi:MAG: flavin reductase family protein [Thermoplasmata archaeon]